MSIVFCRLLAAFVPGSLLSGLINVIVSLLLTGWHLINVLGIQCKLIAKYNHKLLKRKGWEGQDFIKPTRGKGKSRWHCGQRLRPICIGSAGAVNNLRAGTSKDDDVVKTWK